MARQVQNINKRAIYPQIQRISKEITTDIDMAPIKVFGDSRLKFLAPYIVHHNYTHVDIKVILSGGGQSEVRSQRSGTTRPTTHTT